ncbi:MAG: hypothetical protein IPI49_22280 [Myxococcales bacterium]|nr:hypothetical protein [Myxococcales bacterium]
MLLIWHSLRYNFVTDDAFISFVYSRNLAEHGELTYNLGDRVEGYSNFSWTVLLAALHALGISPELASRVLGTACGVGTLVVVYRLTARMVPRSTAWAALPPVFLALSSGFACWSSGGLETQLFCLLCLGAFSQLAVAAERSAAQDRRAARSWLSLGGLVGAAALTRPEGLLLAAVLALCLTVANLAAWRRGARAAVPTAAPSVVPSVERATLRGVAAALVPRAQRLALLGFIALWGPHQLWRLWYYGWPFPNTYYVKAHGPWQPPELASQMWRNGGYYLLTWLEQTGLLWAWPLVLGGLLAVRPRDPRFIVSAPLLAFAAAYLLYTASVGGDFMGLHRFVMPLFPIAALGLTLGLAGVRGLASGAASAPRRAWARAGVVGVAVALVAGFAASQAALTTRSLRRDRLGADHGIDPPAFLIVYTQDRAAIGRALAPCLAATDFGIVGGAGAQPYYARMRAIDVFGLVSEKVAHGEPRIRARAGHTKWASDALLVAHDPTFVFSCYALHQTPDAPALPCAAPWLARDYQVVTMHIPALVQSGTYYSFLAKRRRAFTCPGAQVHASVGAPPGASAGEPANARPGAGR